MTTSERDHGPRPARPAEIAAVEPLVRAKYDELYGPEYWDRKPKESRTGMVTFVIDSARAGANRCIVHTQRDGTEHTIAPATVLAVLNHQEATHA